MTGDEEKPITAPGQASIHDESTKDSGSTIRQNTKNQVESTPSGERAANVERLDSHVVKVEDNVDNFYAHLSEDEKAILKAQVDTLVVSTDWRALYRYGTTNDFLIMAVSALCATAAGAALPLMTVIFGNLTEKFNGYFQGLIYRDEFNHTISHVVLYFMYLGIAEFVMIYVSTVGFIYTGEYISGKIRAHYLEACMRQNIGFFDKLASGEVTTRITADTNLVQDGISETVGLTLNAISTFTTAFIVGFIKSWKLTLILSSTVFAITAVMGVGSTFIVKYSKKSLESYALGGSVAEEVIFSIRYATAFRTQDKLARQYDKHLAEAEKYGYQVKFALAIIVGYMFMIINLTYGLAFWMGSRFLVGNKIQLSAILTILMSVMIGAFSLGNVAPNVQVFTTALAAAAKIFNTIDRISPLDATSDQGEKLDHVEGTIELRKIKHIYPSRPEVTVLDGIDLIVPAGKQTALVGASGSGKSTIVGLVERFYSPIGGQVLLDGHDVRTLNLRWLRQQISLFSQDSWLLSNHRICSIRSNIVESNRTEQVIFLFDWTSNFSMASHRTSNYSIEYIDY